MKLPLLVKRAVLLGLTLAGAGVISYLGFPPIRNITVEFVPKELKPIGKSGLDIQHFGYIRFSSEDKDLCTIYSTTSVRNFFVETGDYTERTRISREICQIPMSMENLEAYVSMPYQPEEESLKHTLDSCKPFRKEGDRWYSNCRIAIEDNRKTVSFTAYEELPKEQQMQDSKEALHDRKADRLDILLLKR